MCLTVANLSVNLGTELSRRCERVFVNAVEHKGGQIKEDCGGLFPVLLPGVGVSVDKCTYMVTRVHNHSKMFFRFFRFDSIELNHQCRSYFCC